ncbi:MAG: phospholipase D-like domain-containing protein [Saprospiraceae bacterium]|nr:phospholipase D-like domain-containing protein [Saprospiraceae bacterium]
MKIIPPYQITSEILNTINQAEKYIVLVSPYVNFTNWDRIKQDLINAMKRGVKVEFFTRFDSNNSQSWEQIELLGIQPKLIKNLHAKLYYSEKSAIVTSMNLLTSSNLNAIEFGSIYHTEEELKELKSYVRQFLLPHIEEEMPNEDDLYLGNEKFIFALQNYISCNLKIDVYCKWKNGSIEIKAGTTFFLALDKVKKVIYLSAIISGDMYQDSHHFINECNRHLNDFEISVEKGRNRSYDTMHLISKKKLSNTNFDYLLVNEKKVVIEMIYFFVSNLLLFKEDCYQKKKKGEG